VPSPSELAYYAELPAKLEIMYVRTVIYRNMCKVW